jgi:hypothetical protein
MPNIDLAGNTLIVKDIQVGATTPGSSGTSLSSTELSFVDGITAGTALASKAVVLDSSKGISTITSATITTLTSTLVNAPAVTSLTNLALNGTGSGTVAIGNVSTGAVTITPATTITGALTPTGGVAAAGGFSVTPRNCHTGGNPASVSTDFSDYTVVITETIRAEVFVPANTSCTGVAILNGSTVAGNVTAYLIDSTGTQITGAVTASTAASGVDSYQRIPWSGGAIALKGPATYWVAVQGNNVGQKINTHTIGNFGADKQTGTTYGALTVATSPTTFTTALGPVASLY